ncbi:MAG: hypothetical protein NVSMB6_05150 [Burkholderiaceae bacterium]
MKTFVSTCRRHQPARLLALAAICLSCALQPTSAHQTRVFKWRDANGVVSYAQKPPSLGTPGVRSVEIDTRSFTPAQRAAARMHLAQIDAAERADARRFSTRLGAADQAVSRAVQSLAQAERAAREGRVPRAGERVGNAGGGSRLRPVYFDRQKRLEESVRHARTRLETAYRTRDQLMH